MIIPSNAADPCHPQHLSRTHLKSFISPLQFIPKGCIEEIDMEEEAEWSRKGRKKADAAVMLEGYVNNIKPPVISGEGEPGVCRTKSLTDEDLEDLKGCCDLGFSFSYKEIPELCDTLPALELCYSMSQRFLDEQQQYHSSADNAGGVASLVTLPRVANWKISSPGTALID
ncbi:uncharacterized protein LOC110105016 isoform X2 [Dendrobium catenatum]|uniref:Uncharacterized protein n=1 Tax=Dendrobium catenatum TaxID=906689 RepID=A0A2I0W7I2_9ASPA|nr:uncharacterized protein LOC110105016 isoform X2 [Dendrobium catenatum]PKU71619.1 hypothetical protein MA16_Dca004461 [Dendrobium catenatum]